MTSTPGTPFERYSPDGAYLIIEPGVESNQWKYDSPVAGESSTMGLALDGLNRFVTKTLPAGPVGDVTGPAGATDNAVARYDGVTGKLIQNSVVTISDAGDIAGATTLNGSAIPIPIGDVVGPAGATDNAVARYDGVTGKLIQNSSVTISDAGAVAGVTTLNGSPIPSPIGDVVGPAGATDNAIARYDGVTGKLIQNSSVTVTDGGIVDTSTATGGVIFPNLDAISLGPEMKNWQIFGGAQAWTGPWAVPLVGPWDLERIGNRCLGEIGTPITSLNNGAAPAAIKTTVPVPTFALPTAGSRRGLIGVQDGGVWGTGAWMLDGTGLFTITPTVDPTSLFAVGSTGLSGTQGGLGITWFAD